MSVTRPRSVMRSAATFIGVSVLRQLTLFSLIPIFTRVLGAERYGHYVVVLAIQGIASAVLSFGLETAVFRAWFVHANDPDGWADTIRTLRVLIVATNAILWFTVVPLVVVAGDGWFGLRGEWWALGLVFGGLRGGSLAVGLSVIRAQERLREYAFSQLCGVFAFAISSVAWIALGGGGLSAILICMLLMPAIELAVTVARSPSAGGAFRNAVIRPALSVGLPLVPHQLGHLALSSSDRFVLAAAAGSAAVGLYGVAYQFATVVVTLITEINRAVLPSIGRTIGGTIASAKHVVHLQRMATLSIGAMSVALGRPVMEFLLPPDFADAGDLIGILAFGMVLFGMYYIPVNSISIHAGRTKWLWAGTFFAAAANLVANLLLVPRLGVAAAAWTTVGGYALLLAFTHRYARRLMLRTPGMSLGEWGLAATTLAAIGLDLLPLGTPFSIGWRGLVVGIAVVGPLRAFARMSRLSSVDL